MNLVFTNTAESIDFEKLMDIYQESNLENLYMVKENTSSKNIKDLYKEVRQAHINYIKDQFLSDENNFICILEDGYRYFSSLRLFNEGDYYLLEALETNPKYRRMGYGEILLKEVIKKFPKGTLIRSEVGFSNNKSYKLHKKVGFEITGNKNRSYIFVYKCD